MPMNILLVDDQPVVIEGLLKGIGWKKLRLAQPFTAHSGQEAQKILQREQIDIVLSDIEMPNQSGIELFRWIRAEYPAVLCILLSAHAEFHYAQEALSLGVFEYVVQPTSYENISEVLKRAKTEVKQRKRYHEAKIAHSQPRGLSAKDFTSVETTHTLPQHTPADERHDGTTIEKVVHYIDQNIEGKLTRNEIAEAVYINPEYLSRLFKKEMHLSLNDYVLERKIEMSKTLLTSTNMPISIIASKAGYQSFSYFSQLFKKHTGKTPNEFRAEG